MKSLVIYSMVHKRMPKKLSQLDYAALIQKGTYESLLEDDPDKKERIIKKVHRQVGKWADMLDIIVYVASNEKLPWTTDELNIPVLPMLKKADTGINQVGDYLTCVTTQKDGGTHTWLPLVIERKGGSKSRHGYPGDLYGTLMNGSNRARFERELSRFEDDHRFNRGQFVIVAECSYRDFLLYRPKFKGKSFNRGPRAHGAKTEAREGTIASLDEAGYHVVFAGSRMRAIRYFKTRIRQSIIRDYEMFL